MGEFKRGKSTIVNALVGEEVAPAGVLPLTSVAIELSWGPPSTIVERLDGTQTTIDRSDVPAYVAEERNPRNAKQVARVLLTGEWPLLGGGVTLIDTPGAGSIHEHNSEVAQEALLEADGAIVVLSADSPLSAHELEMLSALRERQAPTFFVLNKVDHLSPGELAQVRRFVSEAIAQHLGRAVRVYETDARSALARRLGDSDAGDLFGLDQLLNDLRSFITHDLVGALERGARRDLAGLGRSLMDALVVEQAVLEMDSIQFARLGAEFSVAAEAQKDAFEDDRILLRRDVAQLTDSVRARLDDFARREPPKHHSGLDSAAARAPLSRLSEELRAVIEQSVKSSFDTFRFAEQERIELRWGEIAESFRRRTEDRVAAVRDAASELFTIELPRVSIPAVASEHERFFYLFLHIGSSTDLLTSFAGRLVPGRIARPRALRKAREELGREFAKHAGRVAWDLTQRLEEACRALEHSMAEALAASTQAITDAANRAERRRVLAEKEQERQVGEWAGQRQIAQQLIGLSEAS